MVKYTFITEKSRDTTWAYMELPEGGIISTFGDTKEELGNNILEALNLYLESQGLELATLENLEFNYDN